MTDLTIKIPATSANMGSGFDSLGIALDIWNYVRISDGPSEIIFKNDSRNNLPNDKTNLISTSFDFLFHNLKITPPNVTIECENNIPVSRGLGSSSAALIGGLMAANLYLNSPYTQKDILNMAAELEGHPDNVAPAIYGGMQIGVYDSANLITAAVTIPKSINIVLFIPKTEMSTDNARAVLSDNVSRKDAVFNIGRAALLVQAFSSGDLSNLKYATQDMLHQPTRQKLFHPMRNIIQGALNAGALGAALSGSGSTIIAFTESREYTIGYEMADAAMKSGLDGDILVTSIAESGAQLVTI
jgi:homoserine kinase